MEPSDTDSIIPSFSTMKVEAEVLEKRRLHDYDHHDDDDAAAGKSSHLMSASCHGLLEPSCLKKSYHNRNRRNSSSNNNSRESSISSSSGSNHPLSVQSTHSCAPRSNRPPSTRRSSAGRRASTGASAATPAGRRGGLAQHKRHSWMRSSVVRRAATVVDEQVAALCEKSPFLASLSCSSSLQQPNAEAPSTCEETTKQEIALFHRTEVQLGRAIGTGGFAEVYAIDGFDIHSDSDSDEDDDDTQSSSKQPSKRRHMQATVKSAPGGRPAYAIKFLRKKLLSNTREFQHAAIDLAVEAQYLAALQDSPYIVKVHGLTRGGTTAFQSGKHDDFFIIMDHLAETLERRIRRWQKRHANNCVAAAVTAQAADTPAANNKNIITFFDPEETTAEHTGAPPSSYPPRDYHARTMKYAHQIADALSYLHEKQIVYRDLKPQNIGFRERDVIQIFDFGLCRELPKPKGQSHRDESLEDEETFHMSGVGTQRYMAPEILTTRRYNLKADVYSWSMVALEMLTWTKPFAEYNPEEHQLNVAQYGERPRLVTTMDPPAEVVEATTAEGAPSDAGEEEEGKVAEAPSIENQDEHIDAPLQQHDASTKKMKPKAKRIPAKAVLVQDWPTGMADLLQESWTQDVADRLTIQSVLKRMESIVTSHNANITTTINSEAVSRIEQNHVQDDDDDDDDVAVSTNDDNLNAHMQEEVVVEFPSLFSPIHAMSWQRRKEQYERQQQQQDDSHQHYQHSPVAMSVTRDDSSDRCWFGDRQSDVSNSNSLELTMTSASTTLHDSNSTQTS